MPASARAGFGVGQLNASENGTRKIGIDARARLTETLSLTGSAWHEDYLGSDARRIAGRALIEYRGRDFSARAGITIADDRLADGRSASSQILQLGATKRFFDNRLELDAQTELPIGGHSDSIDFPARHRLSARFAVSRSVALIGSYEIADGDAIDARTARLGFDLAPWAGARIALSGNFQNIAEYGPRSFAAFGLSQSLVLSEHWSVDFTARRQQDARRDRSGAGAQSAPSGGERRLRRRRRDADRGFHRGHRGRDLSRRAAGASPAAPNIAPATARTATASPSPRFARSARAAPSAARSTGSPPAPRAAPRRAPPIVQLSWAHRPPDSAFSFLDKLELREDMVRGAVAGVAGPLGIAVHDHRRRPLAADRQFAVGQLLALWRRARPISAAPSFRSSGARATSPTGSAATTSAAGATSWGPISGSISTT